MARMRRGSSLQCIIWSRYRKIALISLAAAIPAEAVNFWLFPFPIDVGLPDDATWYEKLIGFQWVILHLPGLYLTRWLTGHPSFVIFVCGYLDTALLFTAASFCFNWIFHLARRNSTKTSRHLTHSPFCQLCDCSNTWLTALRGSPN